VARIVAALVVVLAATGCSGTRTVVETETVTAPRPAPPERRLGFGHIASLTREGDHYLLRFDPAWFLSGRTTNDAAAEDGAVEPGQPVPNDNYVLEEGHRLLDYVVPTDARVTVLTRRGDPARIGATPITVAELAQVVNGTSALKLFEPLDSGVWIGVDVDTVRAIDQQYRP
jgi:hypothetical protein